MMQNEKKQPRPNLAARLWGGWQPRPALAGAQLVRQSVVNAPLTDGIAARAGRSRSGRPHDPDSTRDALAAVGYRAARLRMVSLPMFGADVLAMTITCLIAWAVVSFVRPLAAHDVLAVSGSLFVPVALGNLLTGLYYGAGSNPVVEFRQLSRVSAIAFVGTIALMVLGHHGGGWGLFVAAAWPLEFAMAPLTRAATRRFCSGFSWWGYPVIVFGAGKAATTVVTNLLEHPEYGLRPVVIVDAAATSPTALGLPVLTAPRVAATVAKKLNIRHAIVALPDLTQHQVDRILTRYAQGIRHVTITSAISAFAPGMPILWRDTRDLAGVAGVEVRNRLLVPLPRAIKRTMDLVLTISGGLCLLPFLGVLAVCVKMSSPGPVLFAHTRIGARGKRFKALKFRSMRTDGDAVLQAHLDADPQARAEWERDHKLKNDPRVTKIGALMRKCSLDELPQLWNVLRGEMSLVGPRPIVKAEIEKYGKCYNIYKAVRPGITGLWQVSGRNDTTYDERLKFDEFYVRNWSPWLDMHLLARTVSALLLSKGAY